MQTTAPEAFDLSRESAETKALYGLDRKRTEGFGRSPTAADTSSSPVRDHSPSSYSMWPWPASDDVKGGQVIGATDPVGFAAIERPIHLNDLHATILHALGIDQHRFFCMHK